MCNVISAIFKYDICPYLLVFNMWFFVLLVFLVLFSGCSSEKEHAVNVVVTDSYGSPIENARVSFSPDSDKGLSIVGYTDASGNITSMIFPGNYTLVVVKPGYFSSVLENVVVPTNSVISIRLEKKE